MTYPSLIFVFIVCEMVDSVLWTVTDVNLGVAGLIATMSVAIDPAAIDSITKIPRKNASI